MGAYLRAQDWSSTTLGPPDRWPQPLRTAIRLILNSGHPMYVWWGPQLLCFYNDAYSACIGPERHPGSVGQPAREVWAEIWPIIGPQIEQVMDGRGATWHENQLVPITRGGKVEDVYWTYSYSPLDDPDASNGVGGVLVVCSETTATVNAVKERAEEVVRQREMFSQAPGFTIIMSGPQHRVEFVNEAHKRLFASEDWVGRTVREAFPAISGQGFLELLDGVFATGKVYRAEHVPVRFQPAGSEVEEVRTLDFIYAPIRDAHRHICGVFCEGFDVTRQVEAEAAQRLSEEKLRLADRKKDEFLATLAHELRNPLAPIGNAAAILQRAAGDREAVTRYAQMIQRQTKTMGILLDDLLEVTRISTGKLLLKKQVVAVADLVDAALEPVREAIASKGHSLRVEAHDGAQLLEVDPVRLAQVLTNLLTNAIKYSGRGGSIVLRAEGGDREVMFEVEDTGIGLSEEQIPTVFDMFTQVSNSLDSTDAGLGIGLAVAKALVELHGGKVGVRSPGLGAGSTFTVVVPRGTTGLKPQEGKADTSSPDRSRGSAVVIADDNVDAADSFATWLEMEGYDVHVAHDGVQAVHLAGRVRPVACFLDIGMPGMNGYDVAKRIRADHGSEVLLVATTGWGKDEDRRLSEESGFDLHMTKPIDVALATQKLAKHTRLS